MTILGSNPRGVTKLNGMEHFTRWDIGITDCLGMNGYLDLLHRNKEPPAGDGPDGPQRLERWLQRQDIACSIVETTCGYSAREVVKGIERLDEVLARLKTRFDPEEGASFSKVNATSAALALAECSSASDSDGEEPSANTSSHDSMSSEPVIWRAPLRMDYTLNGELGISISSVPILNEEADWILWKDDMAHFLILSGFGDLLKGPYQFKPVQGELSTEAFLNLQADWAQKQAAACAFIRDRVNSSAKPIVKGQETARAMLTTLEASFKPQGVATFIELWEQWNSFSLSKHKSVSEYAAHVLIVRKSLMAIDPSLTQPEPFVVQQFLRGLGPAYSAFQNTFQERHDILRSANPLGPMKTFHEAVMAAQRQEHYLHDMQLAKERQAQYLQDMQLAKASIPTTHTALGERIMAKVPYCTYCRKNYHEASGCWDLHPELRRQAIKKRKNSGGLRSYREDEQRRMKDQELNF